MDIARLDMDKVDEAALAVLWFASFEEQGYRRAWKGLAWHILDRLFEKGWITDPVNKNKSVWMTEEGASLAEELVQRLFGQDEEGDEPAPRPCE